MLVEPTKVKNVSRELFDESKLTFRFFNRPNAKVLKTCILGKKTSPKKLLEIKHDYIDC